MDQQWSHTSTVLAMIANVNRDPHKHGPYKAEDFHPYRQHTQHTGTPLTAENLGLLKKTFIKET